MGPPSLARTAVDSNPKHKPISSLMTSILLCAMMCLTSADEAEVRQSIVVVIGAPGSDEFRGEFLSWAEQWRRAAEAAGAQLISIGEEEDSSQSDREILKDCLAEQIGDASETLWLVLIGHGTFDGQNAKFNLRGPDVTATELAEWLKPCQRPLAIVNCTSASGPFINALSKPNRVIVTATKSGYEYNFARFGQYISRRSTTWRPGWRPSTP